MIWKPHIAGHSFFYLICSKHHWGLSVWWYSKVTDAGPLSHSSVSLQPTINWKPHFLKREECSCNLEERLVNKSLTHIKEYITILSSVFSSYFRPLNFFFFFHLKQKCCLKSDQCWDVNSKKLNASLCWALQTNKICNCEKRVGTFKKAVKTWNI